MAGQFIRGLHSLTSQHRGSVATIGSFDGVHLGHRQILQQLRAAAERANLPSVVMVFEPQPNEFFSRETIPARLMRLREKVEALFAAGVDRVLCLQFNQHLRSLSAEAFIQKVLIQGVGVKHLIVGDDFRFGCDRRGDYALLCQAGEQQGFVVESTQTYTKLGERVSSTRIRQLLEDDQLNDAEILLGCPFTVSGRVIYGNRIGHQLGVPTANVGLGRYRSPVKGVYAVEACVGGNHYAGVANVGVRPTVKGNDKPILEVHLFEFNASLYGQFLQTTFRKKLREEKRFDSLDALKQQIYKDVEQGKAFFATQALGPINTI